MPGAILTNAASACMAPLSHQDEREQLRLADLDVLPADPNAPITEAERAYYAERDTPERELALWARVIATAAYEDGEATVLALARELGLDTAELDSEFARQRRRGVGPRNVNAGKGVLFPDVDRRPDELRGVPDLAVDKG